MLPLRQNYEQIDRGMEGCARRLSSGCCHLGENDLADGERARRGVRGQPQAEEGDGIGKAADQQRLRPAVPDFGREDRPHPLLLLQAARAQQDAVQHQVHALAVAPAGHREGRDIQEQFDLGRSLHRNRAKRHHGRLLVAPDVRAFFHGVVPAAERVILVLQVVVRKEDVRGLRRVDLRPEQIDAILAA